MVFLLVVLYIFQGQAHLKQSHYKEPEACQAAGDKILADLHPDAIVLIAACGAVDGQSIRGS